MIIIFLIGVILRHPASSKWSARPASTKKNCFTNFKITMTNNNNQDKVTQLASRLACSKEAFLPFLWACLLVSEQGGLNMYTEAHLVAGRAKENLRTLVNSGAYAPPPVFFICLLHQRDETHCGTLLPNRLPDCVSHLSHILQTGVRLTREGEELMCKSEDIWKVMWKNVAMETLRDRDFARHLLNIASDWGVANGQPPVRI